MPLQSTGWVPRAEQDVLPHPTDLLLAALGPGRGGNGSQLCPLRSQSGKVAKAHEPSEALPSRGTPAGHQYVHTRPPPKDGAGEEVLVGYNRSVLQADSSGITPDDECLLCGDRLLRSMALQVGAPESVPTDNGKQFASRFFQSVCQLLGLSNVYTAAYRPQANGQAERYNRTLQNMLMCFVEEHQDSRDKYATALTYAYNCHVHRTMGTTPFDPILSRPPPAFSLHRSMRDRPEPDSRDRHEFLIALDETIAGAYNRLKNAQARPSGHFTHFWTEGGPICSKVCHGTVSGPTVDVVRRVAKSHTISLAHTCMLAASGPF